MTERLVRLGIDYGTSFSKVVFRDYGAPGGEKAYVMLRNGDFRTPSAVGVKEEEFIFGADPNWRGQEAGIVWHESLKMRVAGEVKQDFGRYCHGALSDLPKGFCAMDLAVLTVGFLISEGKRAVREQLRAFSGTIAIGFTLGMPMSFFDDPQLRKPFLQISRAAWELSKEITINERASFIEARSYLRFAYDAVQKSGDIPAEELRDWVRTEAEAALWWPFLSPAVDAGPYAQLDIGAGTTNISIFRIVPKHTPLGWLKTNLCFFGATSPPIGMDAIDKAIADWKGGDNVFEWRGQEHLLLYGRIGDQLVSPEAGQLRENYKGTLTKAFGTLLKGHAERQAWEHHKVFFLGGGSLVDCLVKQLLVSPLDGQTTLVRADLDCPSDIRLANGGEVSAAVFPHVGVAYGLSGLSAELPSVETPTETPPMEGDVILSRRYQMIEVDDWRY